MGQSQTKRTMPKIKSDFCVIFFSFEFLRKNLSGFVVAFIVSNRVKPV